MTKSELEAGYIAQLADGNCATVIKNTCVGDVLDGKTTRILLSGYNNDLTHRHNKYLNINKVCTFCNSTTDEYYFEKDEVIILWERPKNESEVDE